MLCLWPHVEGTVAVGLPEAVVNARHCPLLPSCLSDSPVRSTNRASVQLVVPSLVSYIDSMAAGQWRGLDVAIKTVIFSSNQSDQQTQVVATEAAIASNLSHKNIVATYHHDILDVAKAVGNELGVYKFYLIQVRLTCRSCCH